MTQGGERRRAASAYRWTVAIAAMMLSVTAARAERVAVGAEGRPRIVNGLTSHAYPTTGALLRSPSGAIDLDNAGSWCSGTLIGCRSFLVAAHCVDVLAPSHYLVYLQHAGIFSVAAIARHPDSSSDSFPLADVAVLTLDDWVTGIAPTAIASVDPTAFIPATGTIVGFGQTWGSGNDYGIKRAGAVQTAACPLGLPNGASEPEVVCWTFDSPLGPPGADANTCNGDSGGPLLLDLGAGTVVAAVTSGGTSSDCLATDHSYDASVYANNSFILAARGADATATCGGLPAVGDAETTVIGDDGTLDASNLADGYTISVPAGANQLRVALNGEDNGLFDADLYVKAGPGAGPADFDCKADAAGVFGACTIDFPAAGTWSIAVQRAAGSGDYQITSTVLRGAAPQCGDGERAFNEDCDGVDAARCAGLCQVDCRCPVPQCGNQVAEVGEQCDGVDATACPGQCGVGCTCPAPCSEGELTAVKARADASRFKFRTQVINYFGTFNGADPRNGFQLTLRQGANTVVVDIPAGDIGWSPSLPDRGRFKWKGSRAGITRVRAIDRTATRGIWKVIVIGDSVAGATAIDLDQPVNVELYMGTACAQDVF